MKRKFLTLAVLSAVTLIIFCGENGLELDSITSSEKLLSESFNQSLINSTVLSIGPDFDKYKVEILERTETKKVTKIYGIKDVVVSLNGGNSEKFLLKGSTMTIITRQDLNENEAGLARLIEIKGYDEYKEVFGPASEWYK